MVLFLIAPLALLWFVVVPIAIAVGVALGWTLVELGVSYTNQDIGTAAKWALRVGVGGVVGLIVGWVLW